MKSIPLRQWEAAAYAAGRLTQIRRVCRPQPIDAPSFVHYGTKSIVKEVASGQIFTTEQCIAALVQFAPYGSPGDRLALREAVTQPLSAVRWHPVITAVRLERVQDMSEADARACGFDGNCPVGYIPSHQEGPCVYHYATQFDRDNPRTPWEDNPYTWVLDVEGAKP